MAFAPVMSDFARHARPLHPIILCLVRFDLALHPPSSRNCARVREVGALDLPNCALPRHRRCTIHAVLHLRYCTDSLFKIILKDVDGAFLSLPNDERKQFVMTDVKDESVSGSQHAFGLAMSRADSFFHLDRPIQCWFHVYTDCHSLALQNRRGRGALTSSDATGEDTR